jgi:hypothetical protein
MWAQGGDILVKPSAFKDAQSMNVNGFSRYPLKAVIHRAPSAPSTERWSLLKVAFIIFAVLKPRSSSAEGTRVGWVDPTARMHDCGGLMIAVKCEMSNMPRFEIVNVPPCP